MSWLEPIGERPESVTTEDLWRSVTLRLLPEIPAAVEAYVSELRRLNVNGSVIFARFEVSATPAFDWFASCCRWHELGFCEHFLMHPTIQEAFPPSR